LSSDALLTSAILGLTIALFVSDRLRLDVVALMSLLALTITGVLPVTAALAGFSSPAVLTIAGLFLVGAALTDTGVADWLGRHLEEVAGRSEARVTAVVMLATALLSAFMSSTGTVAILLPVVGTLARRRHIPPARLFMPLAFAAHLGSNLTLIATPPNILVSDALREAGREPFRFFSFLGPGLAVLVVGVAYMVWVGRDALARLAREDALSGPRSLSLGELAADYGLASALRRLRVTNGSKLVGRTLADSAMRATFSVTVVGLDCEGARGRETQRVVPGVVFAAGDELRVLGADADIADAADALGLELATEPLAFALPPTESLAEVVVPRRSGLVGRTLRETRFRDRHRANVLAVRRGDGDQRIVHSTAALRDLRLRAGDTLLLKGRVKHLRNLRDERGTLVLVAEPDPGAATFIEPVRAYVALGVTAAMLVIMAFGWLPNVVAVLLAALILVTTRCVRPGDIYRAVNWESVVLIAAMLPVAAALERSGLTTLVVTALEGRLSGASPWSVMAMLVAFTSALGMVLSNTATAVLVAPVAVRLASALELSPEPLLIGVAFASSAAFATPIASPVNVLVVGAAGYRFRDFVRVGLPLQLLVLTVTVLIVPLVWRF
jgi:di/tricarboxylate transporter